MTTNTKTTKPASAALAPFHVDPGIPQLFMAQLELVSAVEGSAVEKTALRRRARLLASLDDHQLRLASVLATGIARLCSAQTSLI